ncbi:hypothetical protein PG996_011032 [Apiospora saccharicola]|uniref:Uncharacterized protein n=1 Tax=Apiospora saccharicola TaxID=335842 RepID=A0ABR1UG90_9PEZI
MVTTPTTTTGDPSTSATRGAGPLTTVFTMPDFCQQPWWTFKDAPAVSSSVCMPNNWVDYFGNRRGFYSPGICPKGYTEGCYLPETAAKIGETGKPWNGGPILPGETARICCPAGYSCFQDTHTDADVQYRKCKTMAVDPLTTFVWIIDGTTTVTTTTPALAYAIQVRWQSSDLSNLETDPTVPGATYTGAPHDPTSSDSGGGGGDGGGGPTNTTVIIVGVIVPFMSLVLGILAFWYWRHHYRTKYKPTETEDRHNNMDTSYTSTTNLSSHSEGFAGVPTYDPENKEMGVLLSNRNIANANANAHASDTNASAVVHEADPDAHPWMELPAGEVPAAQEMPATSFVAELADTSVAPYRRQDSIAHSIATSRQDSIQQSIATSHDFEGSSARRKSLRDGAGGNGNGNGSSLHERKFSWNA